MLPKLALPRLDGRWNLPEALPQHGILARTRPIRCRRYAPDAEVYLGRELRNLRDLMSPPGAGARQTT